MKTSEYFKEMRPEKLHQQVLLLREKCGTDFFIKENESFVEVVCPACGHKNTEVSYKKYGYSHVVCKKCSTLYVSPRPDEESLIKYYSEYEAPKFWNKILIETNESRKWIQHKPRVEKLISVAKEIKSGFDLCVEIGAGNGNFSKALDDSNFYKKVMPLEISIDCLESCKAQGLEHAKLGAINELEDNSVDSIVFNDLIEHVFDPLTLMKACYSKLKNKGVLFITTPNGEGFDFKILVENTPNITPPEHIQYFNPESIRILSERTNFEVHEISTPGKLDIQIVKNEVKKLDKNLAVQEPYLNYLLEKDDKPELLNDFQEFLARNLLSSHLMLIGIKDE